jgi:uncharacterized protein (TIGR02145 family)
VRLREIAVKVLPKDKYSIMTAESIIDKLGSKENAKKICREAQCLAEIGRKVSAAYVGQARVGSFGGNFTISMELYNAGSGTLVDSFTGEAKDLSGLLKVINEKAPQMFRKMPSVSSSRVIEEGIENLSTGEGYELDEGKRYLVNLSTEPSGAVLNFNGEPIASCKETPCKAELREGNVRIIAALEQYEKADTTVSIKRNNQNIAITMKPNFGVLDIKPAYLDGIGKNEQWSLTINGKPYSSWENNLSPGKYSVKLSNECYENISFEAGINKGKREVFDMSGKITLKKGGLILSAERDGEPVSEPVFVNGKQVGETPFSGSVPICARVEIGDSRELVDVALKYKEKVKHTHSIYTKTFIDSRDGKRYRIVEIEKQTWMAENLNYNVNGSKCYDNNPANCDKYGRLYDWNKAMKACPKFWHLPNNTEWAVLTTSVGYDKVAGKFLKAQSGWNSNGNGTDTYGFSALPGGYGNSGGSFYHIGKYGYWWSSSENYADKAYGRSMDYNGDNADNNYPDKSYLYSVRCLQDREPSYTTPPSTTPVTPTQPTFKDSRDNNENDDKPEFDNAGDENIIARKEHSETYKKIFEKARFGTRIGLGYDLLLNEAGNSSLWQFEGGGIVIIPLSKKGPFLFDLELNYIHRTYYSAESISIPLLFQFVIDGGHCPVVLEIGAVYERLLETEFGYKNGIGPALGTSFIIKNFIIGFRLISYYTGFGGSRLITENLSASYLF